MLALTTCITGLLPSLESSMLSNSLVVLHVASLGSTTESRCGEMHRSAFFLEQAALDALRFASVCSTTFSKLFRFVFCRFFYSNNSVSAIAPARSASASASARA